MPKLALTDISVRALKPTAAQVTYWDQTLPNFGVRVGLKRKTFVLLIGEARQRVSLGHYPAIGLADARKLARERLAERTLKIDRPTPFNFSEALTLFLATYSKVNHSPRTAHECKRILERYFTFGSRDLSSIKPAEIADVIDSLQATPSEAEHAFRYVRTFFNFCIKRGIIDTSPVSRLEPPPKGPTRERVLTTEELKKVWKKAVAIGYPYGTIVRLLILCGQRAAETANLRWSWIDGEGINLPATITKNRKASRIPIGPVTKGLLATVPNTGDLLFPARGHEDKAFVGFGVSKITLDECGVKNYTHHDLRRGYSTIMASPAVGAPIHVLEKLLNHSSGVLRGVASIYNRYTYWPEMQQAVTAYEIWIASNILPE